ncbi:MAG: FMN-binding protein [Minisyncoccia bacterium]|jgi:uncharacterized protein with FMN-binding domain
MKKYILSLSLIIAFTFYVLLEGQNSISVVSNPPEGANNGGAPSASTPVEGASAQSGATSGTPSSASAPPAPATAGLYRDGSYTGDSVNAYFGNVQVEAVITGGKLRDVKILAYPQDRGTSVRINNGALPKLVQEAIVSQSAQVDVVSGATQTSQGFAQSLASALVKAKN